MSDASLSQSNRFKDSFCPWRDTGELLLFAATSLLLSMWVYSVGQQLYKTINFIRSLFSEDKMINPHFVLSVWSIGTFVSLESPLGFFLEINFLFNYFSWIVLLIVSLLEAQKVNCLLSDNEKDNKRNQSYKKKRWKSKKPFRRKHKGHFHLRAQRRRSLKATAKYKDKDIQSSFLKEIWKLQNGWSNFPDYFDLNSNNWLQDSPIQINPSRLLHLDSFADAFDHICQVNPDIISLFIGSGCQFLQSRNTTRLLELVFISEAKTMDLTKITSTNSIFRFQSMYQVESEEGSPIIFDTGASVSISPHKEDFISLDCSRSAINSVRIKGIESESTVQGVGKIRLMVYSDRGYRRFIETTAYYIPSARVRLLSLCRYQHENPKQGCKFLLSDDECVFTLPSSAGGGDISFDISETNFIPVTSSFAQQHIKSVPPKYQRTFMVLDETNVNLTNSQKALLKLHFCLGHFNLQWIQSLIRKGILHTSDRNATAKTALCKCMACQMAKQVRRPTGTTVTKIRHGKDGALKKNQLRPGGMVSSDQFVSSLPGRLPSTYGREQEKDKYTGGTVFIDEASGLFFVENQVSLGSEETLRTKHKFEREALRHGIPILGYRADNGVYKTAAFRADLNKNKQSIQFSGVGAHHHNGIAERAIRTISTSARSMLIHAMIHWPEETSLDLWPFAIQYAVFLWNRMPKEDSGLSPIEIFYNSKSDHQELRSAKVFGCPSYVLDPRLQDGNKLPRWNPRSKMGQFLGRSREHSSSVGLIRNLKTGGVSAQFHVVFDDHFTTVSSDYNQDNIPVPPNFKDLFRFSREQHYDQNDLIEMQRNKNKTTTILPKVQDSSIDAFAPPKEAEQEILPSTEGAQQPSQLQRELQVKEEAPIIQETEPFSVEDSSQTDDISPTLPESSDEEEELVADNTPSRVSTRGRKRNSKYYSDQWINHIFEEGPSYSLPHHEAFLVESDLNNKSNDLTRQFDILHAFKQDDNDSDIIHGLHPFAFAARANAEDTPRFNEAMSSPDREGFIEAMRAELDQLSTMNAFICVPREKAINEGRRIIDSTWAFRRKRYPDGRVKKLKARLCVRGDQQLEGIDFFDTYSPVVGWSTIRLLLIMSIILDLDTKQVDYTLAFVHAEAEPGTYIEMPRMFEKEGFVLELKRNLYGQRDAPLKFFNYLKEGLEDRGFKQARNEPCLFYSKDVIVLTYIDDCIYLARSGKKIDDVIESMRNPTEEDGSKKFLLNIEDDYAGFLGISINKTESGIELLQTGLIDRILQALSLDNDQITIRTEPASTTPLGKEITGAPRREDWSYSSIIGMMLYLASNSRPDIAFAVHQCARFNHCPRLKHEQAVKRIARYLKGTRDKGLLFKPTEELNLELHADADWAGLWNAELPDDPTCVKSRTGYLITLCGVPVTWSSKLQTEIATSTMHSEYIALSTGMRELLPVTDNFHEICDALKIQRSNDSKVVRVYEDNEGALKLASAPLPKCTPQSKHFAVKYHWFREKIDDYKIRILPIRSEKQKADIFTKGLARTDFRNKRQLLMGW